RRAEIVADYGGDGMVAECPHQPEYVSDLIERAEGTQVVVVRDVRTSRAPVSSQVGSDDVKAGRGDRQHHLSPAVGELRVAVQEDDTRPALDLEDGLQRLPH